MYRARRSSESHGRSSVESKTSTRQSLLSWVKRMFLNLVLSPVLGLRLACKKAIPLLIMSTFSFYLLKQTNDFLQISSLQYPKDFADSENEADTSGGLSLQWEAGEGDTPFYKDSESVMFEEEGPFGIREERKQEVEEKQKEDEDLIVAEDTEAGEEEPLQLETRVPETEVSTWAPLSPIIGDLQGAEAEKEAARLGVSVEKMKKEFGHLMPGSVGNPAFCESIPHVHASEKAIAALLGTTDITSTFPNLGGLNQGQYYRLKVIDGKLYHHVLPGLSKKEGGQSILGTNTSHFMAFTQLLTDAVSIKGGAIPNADFAIWKECDPPPSPSMGFSFCVRRKSEVGAAFPSYHEAPIAWSDMEYFWTVHDFLASLPAFPRWEHKKEIAVWRGYTTGYGSLYRMKDPYPLRSPREQLQKLAKQHPGLIDTALFCDKKKERGRQVRKRDASVCKEPSKYRLFDHDYSKYKYVIDVEGDGCSGRFSKILASQSVILKEIRTGHHFFSAELKPWVHYVPIKSDLSDLLKNLKWLRDNDEKAREIAQNAWKFSQSYLNPTAIGCYVGDLLTKYSRMQSFKPARGSARPVVLEREMFFYDYKRKLSQRYFAPVVRGLHKSNIFKTYDQRRDTKEAKETGNGGGEKGTKARIQ